MPLNPRLRVSILALTTKAAGLLPGDTPSLGHLLCRALGTWAMPRRYPRAAGDDVMPAPVRPLVPHLTPSKAPPHHRSTCRLCCPVLMGRPLGVAQSIGPPGGRAAVTTHSPPPPAAALSVQHALSQGCTSLQARGWAGPTRQLRPSALPEALILGACSPKVAPSQQFLLRPLPRY